VFKINKFSFYILPLKVGIKYKEVIFIIWPSGLEVYPHQTSVGLLPGEKGLYE
jgi:hypothetical protein